MLKVKNRYDKHPVLAQTFDKFQDKHGYYYDEEKRERVFGVVEKVDVYNEIQSHNNECDLDFLKQNLMKQNQADIPETMFFDATGTGDLLDNFNKMSIARDNFFALPSEIRYKYDNNFEKFAKNFNPQDFVKVENNTEVTNNEQE